MRVIAWLMVVLGLVLGTAGTARAATPATTAGATTAGEEEAADSPRASMRGYFDLCDRGRYDEASRYLDIPHGSEKRAGELAQKLQAVINERVWVDPESLSSASQGKKEDGLPPGTEELGKIRDAKNHIVSIRIVRHESKSPEDEPRWVFAASTVQSVDALYATLKGRWLRDRLPDALLQPGPLSLYYWQWLAIPMLAAICLGLGRLLAWMLHMLARLPSAKLPWAKRLLPRLQRPVTMALALVGFWALVPYLALTLRAEDIVERVLRAFGYLTFFWILLRAVTAMGEVITEAPWARSRPDIRSATSVGVRLGKVVVAAIALMVALSELGYPVTTVVTGLGIGGVALALAAQKTVENLFGSLSILADQPFRVGDTIRVETFEGTVESIGLRSTRVRTADRTLVIMPNGKLADTRIESLGPRDRIRFATKLPLARDTSLVQLRAITDAVRVAVAAHDRVRKADVTVFVSGLGESSFDVDVGAMIETLDAIEFAKVREDLLLACVAVIEKNGARLAVPARQITVSGAS